MVNKMDSERVGCSHGDKAYGPGHAHGQDFICRLCGEEGHETVNTFPSVDFFTVKHKKDQGGFNVPR